MVENSESGRDYQLILSDKAQVRENARNEIAQHSKYDYAGCIVNAKSIETRLAKSFVENFKESSQKAKAKQLVAQSLTALDTIGEHGFEDEISRFKGFVNGIKVEFMIN